MIWFIVKQWVVRDSGYLKTGGPRLKPGSSPPGLGSGGEVSDSVQRYRLRVSSEIRSLELS